MSFKRKAADKNWFLGLYVYTAFVKSLMFYLYNKTRHSFIHMLPIASLDYCFLIDPDNTVDVIYINTIKTTFNLNFGCFKIFKDTHKFRKKEKFLFVCL